jgi:hypothetical protein
MAGALVWGVLALALVIAGCGGGDETTALTKGQFLKQGNEICKQQTEKRNAEIRKAIEGKDQTKLLPLAQREKLVLETLPAYAEVPKRLQALGAPEGDEKEVEAITTAMEEAVKSVEADPKAALESTKQFFKASKLASEYGLEECVV